MKNTPRPKINLQNIYSFFEGNLRMLGDRYNRLPNHQKEQVLYRISVCENTCMKLGKCRFCGCKVPGKLYSTKSCNSGKLFPNMMNEAEWNGYKKIKGIS